MDVSKLCPGCMRERANSKEVCPYCGFTAKKHPNSTRCLPINTVLSGKYLIGRVLGQGGFGITYIGFDLIMETRIAIKEYFPVEVVSRDTALTSGNRVMPLGDENKATFKQGLERFVTEARNISSLGNVPGVVSVKDFFYENETAYIVMEYVDGMSLNEYLKLRGGSLPETEALNILRPVMDALVKVHASGMIHRDISPDNIMLTLDDDKRVTSAKLIDFGSARVTSQNDQRSRTIVLKHGYAPEEQYRVHGEQGPWTDVYAICAVLYRMLTGEAPLPAMDRMFQDDIKGFDQYLVKVSKNTAETVMSGLALKKDNRIQNMEELIRNLYKTKNVQHYNNQKKKKENVPLKERAHISKRALAIIIGAVAICLIIVLIIVFSVRAQSRQDSRTLTQATEETDVLGVAIVEPDPQTSYAASKNHAVFLTSDGMVQSLGSNQYGQRNLSEWAHIAAVAAGDTFTAGLKEDGTVVVAGTIEGSENVERWTDIIEIAASYDFLYGLKTDGTVVVNHISDSSPLAECLEWQNIKTITAYRSTICALTENGEVFCLNSMDYSAIGITGWDNVEHIAANADIVVGLCSDGTVVGSKMWKNGKVANHPWEDSKLKKLDKLNNIVQISTNFGILYAVSYDGEISLISAKNKYEKENKDVLKLENVAGIVQTQDSTPATHIAVMYKDGTVKEVGDEVNYGTHTVSKMKNLQDVWVLNGEDYTGSVMGITKNGNLIGQSSSSEMEYLSSGSSDIILKNIKAFDAINYYTDSDGSYNRGFCYLDSDGKVWMKKYSKKNSGYSGSYSVAYDNNVTQISVMGKTFDSSTAPFVAARTKSGKVKLISTDHVFKIPSNLKKTEEWKNISKVLCRWDRAESQYEILGLKKDGTVTSVRSDGSKSETAKGWSNVKSIYGSTYAVGAVFSDGTVGFLTDDSEYDYGQYNTYDWNDIKSLALGLYHTVGLKKDGKVVAVGRNDAGQCDVEGWTDVVKVAVGDSCTLGIKSDGTLLIAGDIGW